MMMNNDVNLNNGMIIWGELNVLMKKCNYQNKEQYSPMKKLTLCSTNYCVGRCISRSSRLHGSGVDCEMSKTSSLIVGQLDHY